MTDTPAPYDPKAAYAAFLVTVLLAAPAAITSGPLLPALAGHAAACTLIVAVAPPGYRALAVGLTSFAVTVLYLAHGLALPAAVALVIGLGAYSARRRTP